MQLYLSKTKIIALLMMIEEAEGMFTGSAEGLYGLYKTNPQFYGNIQEAVEELKDKLRENGYEFEKDVRPIIGY